MDQTVWLDQISLRLRPQRRAVSPVLVAIVPSWSIGSAF
jgi:hypothetical protein